MIEENGHRWADGTVVGIGDNRCRNCQMKHSYYLQIKRASKEQPDREDLKEWMKCKKAESKEDEECPAEHCCKCPDSETCGVVRT